MMLLRALIGHPATWIAVAFGLWTWKVFSFATDLSDAGWEAKLASASRTVDDALDAAGEAVRADDAERMAGMEALRARNRFLQRQVNMSRGKIPLSEACNACRVPLARLKGSVKP